VAILNTVGNFCHTRYELGRILAIYRGLFKQDQVWMAAKKAIAKVIDCDPRHIDRIIKAVENAGELTPFEISALAKMEIDPGKPRNLPIVEAVKKSLPRSASQEEAEAAAEFAVDSHRANRNVAAPTNSESTIAFAKRAVKIFSGQFEHQSAAKRDPGLKYTFEMILAAFHCDVPDLRKYSCMRDVPPPTQ
jgi:hypothetical protein